MSVATTFEKADGFSKDFAAPPLLGLTPYRKTSQIETALAVAGREGTTAVGVHIQRMRPIQYTVQLYPAW